MPDTTAAPHPAPTPHLVRRRVPLFVVGVAFVAGSIIAGTTAAIAVSNFTDVPANHQFKTQIDWMVDQGISQGYDDGSFKPTAPVSRQAFASFLNKYNARTNIVSNELPRGSNVVFVQSATCQADQRALSGGGQTDASGLVMTDSYPSLDGNSWTVRYESTVGSLSPTIKIYALCSPDA